MGGGLEGEGEEENEVVQIAMRDFDSYLMEELERAVEETKERVRMPIGKAMPWLNRSHDGPLDEAAKDAVELFYKFCLSKLKGSKWTDFDDELERHKKWLMKSFPTSSKSLKEDMEAFSEFFVRKIAIHYCRQGPSHRLVRPPTLLLIFDRY